MDEVPQMLRKTISLQINKPLFAELSIFHDFPEKIQAAIAGMMYPVQVQQDHLVLGLSLQYRCNMHGHSRSMPDEVCMLCMAARSPVGLMSFSLGLPPEFGAGGADKLIMSFHHFLLEVQD